MAMILSNYQKYLITGDKSGYIIYCNKKIDKKNRFEAHKDACVRDLSFSMSSMKLMSCSDDRTARIWDFATSRQENIFQEHNSDVTTCDWHPFYSLAVTGSKDSTIRVWDPKNSSGKSII